MRKNFLQPTRISFGNRLVWWLARLIFWVAGWRVEADLPDLPKYVLIVAPHTSYWDGFLAIVAEAIVTCGFSTLKISWLGKHTLFLGPLDGLMRRLGGIPIDRRARHATVDAAVEAFRTRECMVLAITPEGMRKKTRYWKTGFYYIALGAGVPILLAAVDYGRKLVYTGPIIMPSGDIRADTIRLREYYRCIQARHPEKVGEIAMPEGQLS
jgi:1-acyl-sn-glycerol-3-phosphate acyltransferase